MANYAVYVRLAIEADSLGLTTTVNDHNEILARAVEVFHNYKEQVEITRICRAGKMSNRPEHMNWASTEPDDRVQGELVIMNLARMVNADSESEALAEARKLVRIAMADMPCRAEFRVLRAVLVTPVQKRDVCRFSYQRCHPANRDTERNHDRIMIARRSTATRVVMGFIKVDPEWDEEHFSLILDTLHHQIMPTSQNREKPQAVVWRSASGKSCGIAIHDYEQWYLGSTYQD